MRDRHGLIAYVQHCGLTAFMLGWTMHVHHLHKSSGCGGGDGDGNGERANDAKYQQYNYAQKKEIVFHRGGEYTVNNIVDDSGP